MSSLLKRPRLFGLAGSEKGGQNTWLTVQGRNKIWHVDYAPNRAIVRWHLRKGVDISVGVKSDKTWGCRVEEERWFRPKVGERLLTSGTARKTAVLLVSGQFLHTCLNDKGLQRMPMGQFYLSTGPSSWLYLYIDLGWEAGRKKGGIELFFLRI